MAILAPILLALKPVFGALFEALFPFLAGLGKDTVEVAKPNAELQEHADSVFAGFPRGTVLVREPNDSPEGGNGGGN